MRVPPLPVPIRYVNQGWLADLPGRPVPVAAAKLDELVQVTRLAAQQAQHITENGWVSLRLTPPNDVALEGPRRTGEWLQEFIENSTALRVRSTARAVIVNDKHETLLLRREDPHYGSPVWYTPGTLTTPGSDHRQLLQDALAHELHLSHTVVGPALWVSASLRPIDDWEGSVDVAYLVNVTSTADTPRLTFTPRTVADNATEAQWWSFDELRCTSERLTPHSLPWYLHSVTRDEIPMRPPTFVIPPSEADIAQQFHMEEDAFSG